MCVYVCGEVAAAVGGVAYVRSCAHIHQWNVKRKKEGGGGVLLSFFFFSSASLFSVLSLLGCSVGLFV